MRRALAVLASTLVIALPWANVAAAVPSSPVAIKPKPKVRPKPKPKPKPKVTTTTSTTKVTTTVATTTTVASTGPLQDGTFNGPSVSSRYGPFQVTIVVDNHRIVEVDVSVTPSTARSQVIDDRALPILRQETLEAQSAKIDLVSGATVTSQAFQQSLQGILAQAR